jgi:hypothetical protein
MGPRYVVLAEAHKTRALALGRVDVGFTGLHRPLRLEAERSRSKICHSAQLSAQCSLQRLDPLLVAVRPALAEPAMASTTSSFGKTSSSDIYPFWPLQSWFQEVQQLSAAHFLLPPPQLCVRPNNPGMVETFVNRAVQLLAVVFDCA